MSDPFVHLHLHSEYSLLDGAVRIPELMKKVKACGMPAVALTDHGNLFGAIEFYQEAVKVGVKPIIGVEAYVAPGSHRDRNATSGRDAATHLTLLSRDEDGYKNLLKLVSIAHLDGMYYKPRIDRELLSQYGAGLIALSGCLKGEINQAILADNEPRAWELAAQYRDMLGRENFFIELHDHGIEQQLRVNRVLPRIARDLGLGMVGANDVHFLERSQHEAHDVMICIGTACNVADEKRMRYVPELYFKSPQEMSALFREYPEAVSNTLAIAERCNLKIEFGKPKYPAYEPPPGMDQNQYLREICRNGLGARYGAAADSAEIQERLERELGLLEKQGFVNYFLIVWDFINWAKSRGIPVGPGRGSAAGSMVAYLMGITDIDPIKFKLLFERFLNPERVSPPDIDVDFCQSRRGEVIEYVRVKYGERAVAQIATFGTMGAKSVVRDVGRVLGWGYGDADRIAKMIPNELGITLAGEDKKNKATGEIDHIDGAIDKNPELKAAVENEPATRQLWEYACTLEGLTRGVGVHAAGVVISDRDLSEYIPLTRANDGSIVSQYPMSPLGDLGMLKMDFLGLKTLTVIHDAVQWIRRREPAFDIDRIPLSDQPTFDLLNRGETVAVFQLESGGMVKTCRKFDVKDIEDINAILALYRPGPMDLIDDYIKRKKGESKIKYAHPLLEKVTADTYGIFVYQEQVMQAAQVLAGYTLGGADLLRRAMGKKDKDKMAEERKKFREGCQSINNIPEKQADEIFDLLEKFAGYGFNRSHSAAYAWVSYQTAYLKANYPVEFMAGVMGNEVGKTDKLTVFVAECQRMGIQILPPDVNRSGLSFEPERHGEQPGIRYGLAAIKNVGELAMAAVLEERTRAGAFKSLADFCGRVDLKRVNKKSVESLVRCGAFDWTGAERAQLFSEIESAMASAASLSRDRAAGQVSLFDMLDTPQPVVKRALGPAVLPWSPEEKLAAEKELLGFYVTGHPLDRYRSLFESGKYVKLAELAGQVEPGQRNATVEIAGSLVTVEKKFSKKGNKPFAIVTLEDLTESVEVMIFGEAFASGAALIETGKLVNIEARVEVRDEEGVRVSAVQVKPLKRPPESSRPVALRLDWEKTTPEELFEIRDALLSSPGMRSVTLQFEHRDGRRVHLHPAEQFRVAWEAPLETKLKRWVVPDSRAGR
jgi:DNA polymerase-3 subunit alpha